MLEHHHRLYNILESEYIVSLECYWLESVFDIWMNWSICYLKIKSCLTCQLGKFSEVGHRPSWTVKKKLPPIFYYMNHEKLQQTFLVKDTKKPLLATCPNNSIHFCVIISFVSNLLKYWPSRGFYVCGACDAKTFVLWNKLS